MTLSSYELNAQYLRTQMSYEAKITPTSSEKAISEKSDNSEELDNNIAPIVYTDESSLSEPQKFQKLLMEKILGNFNPSSNENTLFPNDINKESYVQNNPYENSMNSLPQGIIYSSSSEYYQKTTIDFSAQATIKTPSGEYNIEINFSYTQEFYERNETQIEIANENFNKPFEIELDKDNDELKYLKSIRFVFDLFEQKDEEKKDIFEEIKELLAKRRENIQSQTLDNFQVWQENSNHEMTLITAQKDGVGIFLANSSSESSLINLNVNKNGYSFEASYSKSESSYAQINTQIEE